MTNPTYQCMKCGDPVDAILCDNCIKEQLAKCQEVIAIAKEEEQEMKLMDAKDIVNEIQ